jgi:hypothetical protein
MESRIKRDPDFYRRLAEQVLLQAQLITDFRYLVEKGRRLDIEFLEGDWPDFYNDRQKLNNITLYMLSLEPDLTPDDILKVYTLLRASLEY